MKFFDYLKDRSINFTKNSELYYLIKNLVGDKTFYQNGDVDARKLDLAVSECNDGKPIAYVLGSQTFLDLELLINNAVLVPRMATEEMVSIILSNNNHEQKNVLDVATGSGCIALSLKYYRSQWNVDALDINAAALDLARSNANRLRLELNFYLADLYNLENKAYDLIVSNPPYLSHDEWLGLPLLHFEPYNALVDRDGDGISCYHSIVNYAYYNLSDGGSLWLEHGKDQRESIINIIKAAGFVHYDCYNDRSGHDRVIVCYKK